MKHAGPTTIAALLAALLVIGGTAVPAFAEEPAPSAPIAADTAIPLEGTLIVYSSPRAFADAEPAVAPTEQVRVLLDSGGSVEVTGPLTNGAVSGSDFVGTVAVPAEDAALFNTALEAARADAGPLDAPVQRRTAVNEDLAAASTQSGIALTVLSADITAPEFSAAQVQKIHYVDIAIAYAWNWPSDFVITDAGVADLVSNLSGYWATQSGGQVNQISSPRGIRRISVPDPCDPFQAWEWAAEAFGDPSGDGYLNAPDQPRHLLVIAPNECANGSDGLLGIGSIGTIHSGGFAWAAYDEVSGPETVAHELGHNFGLGHSNVLVCPGDVVEAPLGAGGCRDEEYSDVYDVMGAAFTFNDQTNEQIPALNITHKARLGAISPTDLATVKRTINLGVTTRSYTLNPISAGSGLRGLRVTDPATNDEYFIEYRSGTGIDAGALYTREINGELVPGVRVLRLRADGSSSVMRAPSVPGIEGLRQFALSAGRTLAIPSGALNITVNSVGATASVTVSVGRGAPTPTVNRVSGPDRYATAVEISKAGFPGTAPVVYLATGENYPDALGAAPAATVGGGPLLLTTSGGLPLSVKAEIQRLKPAKIVVVGGTPAISAAVFTEVKKLAPQTIRLAGSDRFETSRLVIAHAFPNATPSVYVATGLNFPDALSAAAAAGAKKMPVLLVNGTNGDIDAATSSLLRAKKVTNTIVAGSTVTVSAGIEARLRTFGTVKRLGGVDRFDTSQKLNRDAFSTAKQVYLATGMHFPDALAGAALAGAKAAPLYVVQPGCVSGAVLNDLTAFATSSVTLFGGEPALSRSVATLSRC